MSSNGCTDMRIYAEFAITLLYLKWGSWVCEVGTIRKYFSTASIRMLLVRCCSKQEQQENPDAVVIALKAYNKNLMKQGQQKFLGASSTENLLDLSGSSAGNQLYLANSSDDLLHSKTPLKFTRSLSTDVLKTKRETKLEKLGNFVRSRSSRRPVREHGFRTVSFESRRIFVVWPLKLMRLYWPGIHELAILLNFMHIC